MSIKRFACHSSLIQEDLPFDLRFNSKHGISLVEFQFKSLLSGGWIKHAFWYKIILYLGYCAVLTWIYRVSPDVIVVIWIYFSTSSLKSWRLLLASVVQPRTDNWQLLTKIGISISPQSNTLAQQKGWLNLVSLEDIP